MNIYFITVKLLKERYRHESGLHSDTNIVIAESEQSAIDIMYNLMKPYVYSKSDVFVAKDAIGKAKTGHGMNVQEYLITPSLKGSKTQWESLDKLLTHYIRYGYHIYDKDGEVELLNYYQHFGVDEFPDIPVPPTPIIPGGDEETKTYDCNKLTDSGFYNLSTESINTPITDKEFRVEVGAHDDIIMQTAYLAEANQTRIYYRTGNLQNSEYTWTRWIPISHEGQITEII